MSDERKHRHLQQLGKKEATFLRLKRTKVGLSNFRTVILIRTLICWLISDITVPLLLGEGYWERCLRRGAFLFFDFV